MSVALIAQSALSTTSRLNFPSAPPVSSSSPFSAGSLANPFAYYLAEDGHVSFSLAACSSGSLRRTRACWRKNGLFCAVSPPPCIPEIDACRLSFTSASSASWRTVSSAFPRPSYTPAPSKTAVERALRVIRERERGLVNSTCRGSSRLESHLLVLEVVLESIEEETVVRTGNLFVLRK